MRLKSVKILVQGSNEVIELKIPGGFLIKLFKRTNYYEITLDYQKKRYRQLLWGISLNKEWQLYTLRRAVDEMIENAQVWTRGEADDGQPGRLLEKN